MSTFVFAECCVFDKQSQRPGHCGPSQLSYACSHQKGRTFSRSYGAMLPSSFTRVLSSACEFSSYPPVSVYGRSEEHTSDLQSLMRIPYAVFCLQINIKFSTTPTKDK